VFNVEFTAGMEEELDDIEEGKREWQHVVRDLWTPLSRDLERSRRRPARSRRACRRRPTSPAPPAACTSW
jgi:DNA topoisomerase-1